MIGALRHRLTLQQESRTPDGLGGYALAWTNVATLWGRVEPLGGEEPLEAMRLGTRVTHRVRIRHRSGVTASMRLLFGGRTLNVRAVIDDGERRRWLDLLCEEGAAT